MSMRFNFYIGILVFYLSEVLQTSLCFEFPPPLTKCHFNDESCYIEQVQKFLKLSKTGIPELDVESFDPLFIKKIDISTNNGGATSMNLKLTDIIFSDWTDATVTSIKGFQNDPSKPMKLSVTTQIPHLKYKAKYSINGKILIFPITGEGDSELDAYDVTVKASLTFKSEKREDGKTYLKADKCLIQSEQQKGHIHMTNLFNGDKELSENVHKVINDNFSLFSKDMDGPVNKADCKEFVKLVNKFLKKIPYDEFFLE